MNKKRIYVLLAAGLLLLLLITVQCGGEEKPPVPPETIKKDVQFLAPSNEAQYVIGDPITVSIQVNNPDMVEGLELWVDDTLYQGNLELKDQTIKIDSKPSRVGRVRIQLKYIDAAGEQRNPDNRTVVLFSDIAPETIECKIVNTYPHNPKSYTQGLEFYEGKMFEGTGQKGTSVLAEVDLPTGEQVRKIDLDPTIFGEGITVLNDTVYQLTYISGKCFMYDLTTFEKLNEFTYPGEGWGLCNNGNSILMSNGSDKIEWRDPQTFMVTKTIEIFDDQSNIGQINELELINGDLYANLYMDSKIARIDTATGKVLQYINCAPLVNAQPAGVDVLNGIAENDGKIYLTGKWWPNLYEVSFE